MIHKIPADDRYLSKHYWLSTYHLFSFADYYDPENMNFGVLRVFNDDTIDAHNGFGQHGHRDMEIVTIVLDGVLTHTDSMGNSGTIKAGEVQYMSAGSGVTHSEVNDGDKDVHLYQIWIMPKEKNLHPNYGQKDFSHHFKKNALVPVASDKDIDGVIHIEADATLYVAELEVGKEVVCDIDHTRGLFVYVEKGEMVINGSTFTTGDQARITGEKALEIKGKMDSRFVMIDAKY